ncbi:dihydrofolate synthase / folylpolyglutamate synthase [Ruaniaceae bacterium KH17]|nr:dihydrofolate synthase / folylpolyglutamate synthase [Ruaniaceae bacterium KH17]
MTPRDEQGGVEQRVEAIYQDILTRAPEHKVQPSLERVRAVVDLMANPERTFRTIHVAGTNGKTSVTRMAESLVRALGLRTGRFTSPHLHTVRERIAIDGEPITPERFIAAWEDVAPYVEMVDAQSLAEGGPRMSFFEVFTVMAFAAFADAPVDVAIIETGMGGRWDATNVVDGEIAVITPIDIDHTQWLGHTMNEIAGEKAGIIKPGATVIVAEQNEVASGVLAVAAAESGAKFVEAGEQLGVAARQVAVGGQLIDLRTPNALYADIYLPLFGAHQADNAALALAAVEALIGRGALPGNVVEEGFAKVTSPGRLEVVRTSPAVIVDAGHNPHGLAALGPALDEAFTFERRVAVVACMADKDAEGILAALEPLVDEIVVTQIRSPRAMPVEDLAEIARDIFDPDDVHVAPVLADAIDLAAARAEIADLPAGGAGVIVVGSVLLAAEVRALFGKTDG